jgi:catechol 1,2-dioxygenase
LLDGHAIDARKEKTAENILGPFYKYTGLAPFRGKSTPVGAPGVPALIYGVAYGYDTQAPLPGVELQKWHADHRGHYSDEEDNTPLNTDSFINRVRMITDENGYYELETIVPAPYQIGVDPKTGKPIYRTVHWHLAAFKAGYKLLVTQEYKKGEELNKSDKWYLKSLEIDFKEVTKNGVTYLAGEFPIVLDRALR